MDLAHLRAVTDESLVARAHPHGTVTVGQHYPIPRGAFVGEHTGAVIIDPAILTRLLDIADAAINVVHWLPEHGRHDDELAEAVTRLTGTPTPP